MNKLFVMSNNSNQLYADRWTANNNVLMPITNTLKAYYKFNNGAITTDFVGSNTLTNTTCVSTASGKNGYGVRFYDNTSDLNIASPFPSISGSYPITICMWFYLQDTSLAIDPLQVTSSGSPYIRYVAGGTQRMFFLLPGFLNEEYNITKNVFSFLVFSYNFDGADCYAKCCVNNDIRYVTTTSADVLGTITNLKFGYNSGYVGELPNPAMDELSIWNRYLTDSEILALYNSGTGSFYIG